MRSRKIADNIPSIIAMTHQIKEAGEQIDICDLKGAVMNCEPLLHYLNYMILS